MTVDVKAEKGGRFKSWKKVGVRDNLKSWI